MAFSDVPDVGILVNTTPVKGARIQSLLDRHLGRAQVGPRNVDLSPKTMQSLACLVVARDR